MFYQQLSSLVISYECEHTTEVLWIMSTSDFHPCGDKCCCLQPSGMKPVIEASDEVTVRPWFSVTQARCLGAYLTSLSMSFMYRHLIFCELVFFVACLAVCPPLRVRVALIDLLWWRATADQSLRLVPSWVILSRHGGNSPFIWMTDQPADKSYTWTTLAKQHNVILENTNSCKSVDEIATGLFIMSGAQQWHHSAVVIQQAISWMKPSQILANACNMKHERVYNNVYTMWQNRSPSISLFPLPSSVGMWPSSSWVVVMAPLLV